MLTDEDLVILAHESQGRKIPFLKVEQGHAVGKLPSEVPMDLWEKAGHVKTSLLSVIRAKCLDCASTNSEVRNCTAVNCALWPYRMGSNPFRPVMSDEQREAASARLKEIRRKQSA
jgi:hypothetical protein